MAHLRSLICAKATVLQDQRWLGMLTGSLKPRPGSQLRPVLSITPSAFAALSYALVIEGSCCFIAWLQSIDVSPFLKGNVTWSLTLLFGDPPGWSRLGSPGQGPLQEREPHPGPCQMPSSP